MKKVLFALLLFAFPAYATEPSDIDDVTCETLLDLPHALGPTGRFRVVDLTLAATQSSAKAHYFLNIQRLSQAEFPELKISDSDRILALDIRGDKQGYLRRYFVYSLSHAASDVVGLHVVTLNYRATDFSERPVPRVLVILKAHITDYRDTDNRIESPSGFPYWAATQLEELMLGLTKHRAFDMGLDDVYFERAFALLGKSTLHRSEFTRSKFALAFPGALSKLQSTLTALDFLYFRPSFWDDVPAADEFAKRAFVLMTQNDPREFEAGFKDRTLFLRKKLLASLHEKPARAYYNFATPIVQTAGTAHSGAVGGNPSVGLSGVSNQQVFGTDFQAGHNHQFQTLHDLTDPFGGDIGHLIESLEQHGYTDMTQLQGLPAEEIMDRCHFSLSEFKTLAETLSANGIYFWYSWPLFRQFTSQERAMVRPPMNQMFRWNPKTNGYFLKAEDKK